MATYKAETILVNILAALKGITVANGYNSAVGSDSVWRAVTRPPQEEIDETKLPALWLLDGSVELIGQKSETMTSVMNVTIFGVVKDGSTPSTTYNSLLWDCVKLIWNQREWATSAAYYTRIDRIGKIDEYTKPYAAFEIEIAVKFESIKSAP